MQHERRVTVTLLVLIPLACWTWIALMARDMYGSMHGPSAWMMTASWDAPHLVLLWAMWAVMMTGMMLPSAAPLILLYAGALRTRGAGPAGRRIYALAGGYLLVWALFSVAATALQRVLSSALVLTPMMEPATPWIAAAILAAAGLYQLTPLKRACLRVCRSPLAYLLQHWRSGDTASAFRLGMGHGLYCLGCCWAMMLLLFAGGVMNLVVIVALTAWVLAEKLAPFGERTAEGQRVRAAGSRGVDGDALTAALCALPGERRVLPVVPAADVVPRNPQRRHMAARRAREREGVGGGMPGVGQLKRWRRGIEPVAPCAAMRTRVEAFTDHDTPSRVNWMGEDSTPSIVPRAPTAPPSGLRRRRWRYPQSRRAARHVARSSTITPTDQFPLPISAGVEPTMMKPRPSSGRLP